MPPKKRVNSKVDYYITVVLDSSLGDLYTALAKHNSSFIVPGNNNKNNKTNNNGLLLNDSQNSNKSQLSDGGKGNAAGMYLVKEDTGFESCAIVVVATQHPYIGSTTAPQQQQQPSSLQVCAITSILRAESVRALFKNGYLADFQREGARAVKQRYTKVATAANTNNNDSDNNESGNDDDDGEGGGFTRILNRTRSGATLDPKTFLLIETKPGVRSTDDLRIVADTMILQRGSGVSHISFTNSTTPTQDSTSFMLCLANYFSRRCVGKEGPVAQTRDRDDSVRILEPSFLEGGKIEPANSLQAYQAFLCEIDGITRKTAINIVARFPTLRKLLDAIDEQDQDALEVLANTKQGEYNRAMGRAIVQRIIDRVKCVFDEDKVLRCNARTFYEAKNIVGGSKK